MRRAHRFPAVLVLAAAFLVGCSSPPDGTGLPHGHVYIGSSVTDDGKARPLVPGTMITIGFTSTDVNYDAGCNQYGWAARVDDGHLVIPSQIRGVGGVGCDSPLDAQEKWLGRFLNSEPTIGISGDTLTLSAGSVTVTLTDRESANPGQILIDSHWVVDFWIMQGKFPSQHESKSVPHGVASIDFGADGRLTGATGCHAVTTTWTATRDIVGTVSSPGGTMTFGRLTPGKSACTAATADVDRAVLAALVGTVKANVSMGYLTITAASGFTIRLNAA